jgi:hypothetical protein
LYHLSDRGLVHVHLALALSRYSLAMLTLQAVQLLYAATLDTSYSRPPAPRARQGATYGHSPQQRRDAGEAAQGDTGRNASIGL